MMCMYNSCAAMISETHSCWTRPPWFGFVAYYQSQLATGKQLHLSVVVQSSTTEGSSGVTLLCLVTAASSVCILKHTVVHLHWSLPHTYACKHTHANTHYSGCLVVTGGQKVTEAATAPNLTLSLSCLCNKCDRLISPQKEQLPGVV